MGALKQENHNLKESLRDIWAMVQEETHQRKEETSQLRAAIPQVVETHLKEARQIDGLSFFLACVFKKITCFQNGLFCF